MHYVVWLPAVLMILSGVVLIVGRCAPGRSTPLLDQYPIVCALARSHRGPPFLVLDRASSRTDPLVWLRCGHTGRTHG